MNHRKAYRFPRKNTALRIAAFCAVLLSVATVLAEDTSDKKVGKLLSVNTKQNDTTLSIELDGRPAMQYRFADVKFKPYIECWHTPAGINVLRDSPHDHLHHHALMFAVAVDGVNFWEEHSPQAGKEIGQKPGRVAVQTTNGTTTAAFSQDLDWKDSKNHILLKERRIIELIADKDLDASLIDWTTTLSAPPGKKSIKLSGSCYFGLGMRFVQSMDNVGKMISADGVKSKLVLGHAWMAPARWMAYTTPANGKTVTVAIFDHPDNPRHPGGIFHMTKPFAYLSATIGLADKPYDIKADKPLTLRYGAALWDGEVGAKTIEAAYRLWSKSK